MAETESQRKANLKYRRKELKQITISFFPKNKDLYEMIHQKAINSGKVNDWYISALSEAAKKED